MNNRFKIYKKPLPEGFYVYSSSEFGHSVPIRIAYVQSREKTLDRCITVEEAIELGNMLIQVAQEYQKGIETGL